MKDHSRKCAIQKPGKNCDCEFGATVDRDYLLEEIATLKERLKWRQEQLRGKFRKSGILEGYQRRGNR